MEMGRSAVLFAIYLAVFAVGARAGEGEPETPVDYEAVWDTLNDTSASFESRVKAESDLLAASNAEHLEFVLKTVFTDISVTTPEGVKSLPYMDARRDQGDGPFLVIGGPGSTLQSDDRFTPARQVAYSRARVLSSLFKFSEPEELRREKFTGLFEKAVSTPIGDRIDEHAMYTQEFKEWLITSLFGGVSRNWSEETPGLLLEIFKDATLSDLVRAKSVRNISSRSQTYWNDKGARLAWNELIDIVYESRREHSTYQIMPEISAARDPKVSVLVADWVIALDAELCDIFKLRMAIDRFHWHFPDALPQQQSRTQMIEFEREWRDRRVELNKEANRTGDWSGFRAFEREATAKMKELLVEQHQEIVDWASNALPDLELEAESEL